MGKLRSKLEALRKKSYRFVPLGEGSGPFRMKLRLVAGGEMYFLFSPRDGRTRAPSPGDKFFVEFKEPKLKLERSLEVVCVRIVPVFGRYRMCVFVQNL